MSTSAHLTSRSRTLLSARRFQIERDAALVAVVQVTGIGILGLRLRRDLVPDSPHIAGGRFDFDHVRAKVGQDHRGAGTGDEARKVHDFQSRKDIVRCMVVFLDCMNPVLSERPMRITHWPLKLRLALFEEGRRAFLLVFGAGTESEERGFE